MTENNTNNMEEMLTTLESYVQQAKLNRIKGVLENYVKEWEVEANIIIPTRITYPKPIFLYLEKLNEIPMEVFDWIGEFSKYYDMKYVNLKGNLFALYIYKDFDRREEKGEKEASLYEIYERERKSIYQREDVKEESVYDYNIKKGITPLVTGEREQKTKSLEEDYKEEEPAKS
ncbi:MAG: hypothetical protein GPJ51_11785 [Candidatus Heimdallarchaeota archaeon]|nr:hypothetical protein [Candidatus Heimdallarchaeota archaeon]